MAKEMKKKVVIGVRTALSLEDEAIITQLPEGMVEEKSAEAIIKYVMSTAEDDDERAMRDGIRKQMEEAYDITINGKTNLGPSDKLGSHLETRMEEVKGKSEMFEFGDLQIARNQGGGKVYRQ